MIESTSPSRTGAAAVDEAFVGTAAPGCPAGRSPAAALPSVEKERPAVANHTTRTAPTPLPPRFFGMINLDMRRYSDSTQLPPLAQQTQVMNRMRAFLAVPGVEVLRNRPRNFTLGRHSAITR